jgi:hypothetical protein
VRPIMEYACVVWDPITRKNITELERVQRKAARFVMGDYKTTSPVSNKTLIQRWYMVGMVGRTSQLACQRSPHVGPT